MLEALLEAQQLVVQMLLSAIFLHLEIPHLFLEDGEHALSLPRPTSHH